MGDWEPDRTSLVEDHRIYFWVVPADVGGHWRLEIADKRGSTASILFDQAYQNAVARIQSNDKTVPVRGARLQGRTIFFTVDGDLGPLTGPALFTGTVGGAHIEGTFTAKDRTGTWRAKRAN
jgi:hypothetical protein